MINPFSRPTTPQEWRDRARALQAQLEGLTIAELMRGVDKHGQPIGRSGRGGYDPNQPRVPAGHSDGGQWTDRRGGGAGLSGPAVISDVTPDNDWQPGVQYVSRARSPRGGPLSQATPAQLFHLSVAQAQARDAIRRVQEIEPNWRPQPSAYQTVDGLIRAHEADAQQAGARLAELARRGIGPGPYAGESIPARGPERDFTVPERREGNRIGLESGCHTCGTRDPGTVPGNFVLDHQLPSALNPPGVAQRLYPQCLTCSRIQGGWTRRLQTTRD